MAATARNNNRRLHPNSLPLIDLRLLSQTDLQALAASPQNDGVLRQNPKIDKSVFNESAGSRRQTFSRLRFAPARTNPPPKSLRHPLDEDNSQVVSLLKSLFCDGQVDLGTGTGEGGIYGTDIGGFGSSATERGDEEDAGCCGREVVDNYGTSLNGVGALIPIPVLYLEYPRPRPSGDEVDLVAGEAKNRGRPPKVRDVARKEDPYQVELERRTKGMRTRAELVEFLEEVGGEWATNKMKRKVVDADSFGQWLPSGWRIKLCLMKRVSFFWLTCSCYISPDGQQFATYQEASSYLNSFPRLLDAGQLSNSLFSSQQRIV